MWNLKPLKLFLSLSALECDRIFIKTDSTEFEVDVLQDQKLYCLHDLCIFQPGNYRGWGSEGVKNMYLIVHYFNTVEICFCSLNGSLCAGWFQHWINVPVRYFACMLVLSLCCVLSQVNQRHTLFFQPDTAQPAAKVAKKMIPFSDDVETTSKSSKEPRLTRSVHWSRDKNQESYTSVKVQKQHKEVGIGSKGKAICLCVGYFDSWSVDAKYNLKDV